MEVKEIVKSAVGVKNMTEDFEKISIRRMFNMWAKEVQDLSYKSVSETGGGVYANLLVDRLKNIG